MAKEQYSPKDFLKNRRPERFSDSVGYDAPLLDRSQLEYHLDTLTSRGEETPFEQFARRLLEKTVCPNLISHTGPTGGGDSKVDTETHPVAESLALGWYIGHGTAAPSERWAFAFSAKADWRPKLIADIAKAKATTRGYAKAFFVTSQYVSDKKRSLLEDELRNTHGIDVRIFDRAWILDNVFKNRLEQLAVDELGITTILRREFRRGPLDTKREQDLEEIEGRIQKALQEKQFSGALVDDCILAADLARSLERPQVEIEGRYSRADTMASRYGTARQQIQVTYDRCWTAFFWYEDYRAFLDLYPVLEQRIRGSNNVHDLQLQLNSLSLLHGAVNNGAIAAEQALLPARRQALSEELLRLAQEPDRPSAALQAQEMRLLLRLLARPESQEIDEILRELSELVTESERYVGFPFTQLVQILTELGEFLGGNPEYEKLFETIASVSSRREGEITAARMFLVRGEQELKSKHYYEAIRSLGRALGRLYKDESKQDAIRALYMCAIAYERVGLLWAARGTMLAAASLATTDFWASERISPSQALCYNRVKWLELRLGRLPQILSWYEIDQMVRSALGARGFRMESLEKESQSFDAMLGMLLMRATIGDLKEMTKLPNMFQALGLPLSAMSIEYSLGHEAEISKVSGEKNNLDFFKKWRELPAGSDVAKRPLLYSHKTVELHSRVLGCHFIVESQNNPACITVAESVLAAIEGLLSTGALLRIVAMEPEFRIVIRQSDFADAQLDYEVHNPDGRPSLALKCAQFNPHALDAKKQAAIKDKLFEIVTHIVAHVFSLGEPEEVLTKLFRDERASQRAIDFASSFVVTGNVLGHEQKDSMSDRIAETYSDFPLLRDEVWDEHLPPVGDDSQPRGELKLADPSMEPPPEMLDPNLLSHDQIETVSLIRTSLWDRAKWSGTGFVGVPDNSWPPLMVLLFKDTDAGKAIFEGFRSDLGDHDKKDKLRVSIIKGISKSNRHAYRVTIGLDPTKSNAAPGVKQVVTVTRINTMDASTDANLNRFLEQASHWHGFLLTYGEIVRQEMKGWGTIRIRKGLPIVRNAWEIGLHDVDSPGIQVDDDPIIPSDQPNPPIRKLLAQRSARASTKPSRAIRRTEQRRRDRKKKH